MIKLSSAGPIVMVDDNGGDLFFVERCFDASKLQNRFLSYRLGQDFLTMLAEVKAGQLEMPALVLMDLNMPGMNGLDVLAMVRDDAYFDEMPIFCVLTSSRDPRDAERAKKLRVSGVFTKASSMEEYIAFFNSLAA